MTVIAILCQKGGAGKTTLALHLAVAAERAGRRAAIFDLDPQGSAMLWSDNRAAERPEVRPCLSRRLGRELADGAHDLVVLDTAPQASDAALAAASAADLVVVPCRPSLFDLDAVKASVDLARIAATPAVAALNAVPPRGRLAEEARAALAGLGLPALRQSLGHRQAFVHSLTAGLSTQEFEPAGKAACEADRLYEEVAARACAPAGAAA